MPVPRLALDDHEVLKLDSVLCLLRPHYNTYDDKNAHKVNIEIVSDISDTIVKPESRHKYHKAAACDSLDMLPLHRRDNA
jgi:hypothetical protein